MHNLYTSNQGHMFGWGLYSYGKPVSSRTSECVSATTLGMVSSGVEVTWCSPTGNPEPTPENSYGSICGN